MAWIPLGRTGKTATTRKGAQRTPRFLVDQNLGEDAARVLRARGWNAQYVGEIGLVGKSDEDISAAAWKTGRVIVTHDRDFLDNRRFPPGRNAGVVVFVVGASGDDDARLLNAFTYMQWLTAALGQCFMRGAKIIFADDEHVTIERWNLSRGSLESTRYYIPENGEPLIWVE